MFKATRDVPNRDVKAGITRISQDCSLLTECPEAGWVEVTSGPGSGERFEVRAVHPDGEVEALYSASEVRERIAELVKDPRSREMGTYQVGEYERDRTVHRSTGDPNRDECLRALERREDVIDAKSGDRLVDLVERDRFGHDSKYLVAVSDPLYAVAFGKLLAGGEGAARMLTPAEAEAVQRVGEAMTERALAVGEGSTGGYALPIAIDPSIILVSSGQVNPWRDLATVTTISTSEWRGVRSEGVTAKFVKEATEAEDKSPTLEQPTIIPEKAHSFVPFSIEVGEDWTTLQGELGRLFRDAKDQLEAEKFTSGAGHGSFEPEGILKATEVKESEEAAALKIGDAYAVQEALPARFQPNATYVTSMTIANKLQRLTGPGSEEPSLFNEDGTRMLRKPWRECSMMTSETGTGKLPILYGDVATGYRIVDRVGMRVEVVPHLFGENHRPTGERGLYCYWRTSAEVVAKQAIRILKVK